MKQITCPKCDFKALEDKFEVAIRQKTEPGVHYVNVGFECPKCKHEFGFE